MATDLSAAAFDEASLQGEPHSAVSWGAILAGAVAALALSFVLVALAAGFALKLPTPWPGAPGVGANFSPMLGAGMIVVQVLSSALGGYLAGRLRAKWINVHGHEAHFRDTAHGLITWAVSTLAGVVLVATVLAPLEERAVAELSAAVYADTAATPLPTDPVAIRMRMMREESLTAQASFFMGVGLLLGAFTASVAAAVGGGRRDDMHARYRSGRLPAE